MRILLPFLFLFVAGAHADQIRTNHSPTEDYCLNQGIQILSKRFPQSLNAGVAYEINSSGIPTSNGNGSKYYTYSIPKLCSGEFYLEMSFVDIHTCSRAHYGNIPLFFVGLSASGDCTQKLNGDSEPVSSY